MIYAINKQTKEHRPGGIIKHPDWTWVEADADGWIKHDGGECPLPVGERCDIQAKTQSAPVRDMSAATLDWRLVRHYRPILDEPAEPEAPEWDGEGLPPIGASIEVEMPRGEKRPAVVLAIDHNVVVVRYFRGRGYRYFGFDIGDCKPLRTPAQRAEEEAISAMSAVYQDHQTVSVSGAMQDIYRAIRDGKIPGIKLVGE